MAARVYMEVFPLAAQSNGYLHNAGQKNNTHTISHLRMIPHSPRFCFRFYAEKKPPKFDFHFYMIRKLWINCMYV